MRPWLVRELLLTAILLSSLPTAAQDRPEAAQYDQAAAGNVLFEDRCRRCHSAADLAERYFAPEGAGSEAFTRKLGRHGGTDENGDRDIAAFLKNVAEGGSTETDAIAQ